MQTPATLAPLLTSPVAILGGGVSGRGAAALIARLGGSAVIYDERAEGAIKVFGREQVARHHLVVISPGFAPQHPWVVGAREGGCTCLGELDLGALCWRGRVVAITGTNGKTTLTEFLTHALTLAGQPAFAAGNIGRPLAALAAERDGGAPDEIAVCEVSSFQAEILHHLAPEAALWTNFAEDHLERHLGYEAYFLAKWRLLERTPVAGWFAGAALKDVAQGFGRTLPPESLVVTQGLPADPALEGTVFERYPQRENFALAQAWWHRAGFDGGVLRAAARSFRLGRHRFACVAERDGVRFWNDSKATNFHAVEAALATFEHPVLLIAGGKAKGGDIAGFVRRIARRVRHMALMGETAPVLATFCHAYHVAHTRCDSLAAALECLCTQAASGDDILLSPGFASFDQFAGYDDRGRQFEALVKADRSSLLFHS